MVKDFSSFAEDIYNYGKKLPSAKRNNDIVQNQTGLKQQFQQTPFAQLAERRNANIQKI